MNRTDRRIRQICVILLSATVSAGAVSGCSVGEPAPDDSEFEEVRQFLGESRPGWPNDIVEAEATVEVGAGRQTSSATVALPYRGAMDSTYTIFAPSAAPGNGYWLDRRKGDERCIVVLLPETAEAKRGAFGVGTRFQRALRSQVIRWAPSGNTPGRVSLVLVPPEATRIAQRMIWRGGSNTIEYDLAAQRSVMVAAYTATDAGRTMEWHAAHSIGQRLPHVPRCPPGPPPKLPGTS